MYALLISDHAFCSRCVWKPPSSCSRRGKLSAVLVCQVDVRGGICQSDGQVSTQVDFFLGIMIIIGEAVWIAISAIIAQLPDVFRYICRREQCIVHCALCIVHCALYSHSVGWVNKSTSWHVIEQLGFLLPLGSLVMGKL